MLKKEVNPYWNLSVTILNGNIKKSYDYWSENDCYIIVNLPTASARTYRTKTISNSNKPVWNETFRFRLQSNVKNILELLVYDEDPYMRDDHIATVLFDTDNLTPEKKEKKCFILNDTTKDELWVEFEITKSSEVPSPCMSNGVLVAGPFCELKVEVDQLLKNSNAMKNMVLQLKGAYKEDLVITNEKNPKFMKTLNYYVNRNLEMEFNLTPESGILSQTFAPDLSSTNPQSPDTGSSVPLKPLPAEHQLTVSLPLGQQNVDVELKTDDSSTKELDVRLDFNVPMEEQNFLVKRRKVVSQALKKALKLSSPPEPSKVPLIAVVCSGGGTRAMTGTYGSLRGLQKLQLVDTVSYITGLSGSTWALSSLYEDPNWSQSDIIKCIESTKKEISKSMFTILSHEQLRLYKEKMREREKEGYLVSYIDMWGLAVENLIRGQKRMGLLSDMQKALSEGQNPLPIFTAVNMKDSKAESTTEAEWCEFTPYEVGISKYGGFVPTQNFGSEYYLGHMVKKLPESRLPFLLGIWSSIFSFNLTQILGLTPGSGPTPPGTPGAEGGSGNTRDVNKAKPLGTATLSPVTESPTNMLGGIMTTRPIISQMYNFLRGMHLHRDYSENSGFITWKDKHPDAFPNTLTPADNTLSLVDAGFAINSGFPPVVGPQRQADVILSLNYSWDQDHFMIVKQTYEYCVDRKIPFPKIDFKKLESEPLKEVYVFEDKENPEAPIVLHFPLVNITFREFKAPGVKRVGAKELNDGAVDVDFKGTTSPYITRKITYTPEDFDKLINLTCYNILNNKDVILKTLNEVVSRKSK